MWRSVLTGYPPDGQLVLTKVKCGRRNSFTNSFTKFLVRRDGSWFTENDRKIGWHPTHWQEGEP